MKNVINEEFVKSSLVRRSNDAHKYSVGSLLSICGSYGMAGAAIMSGKAALRSGIGLLRIVVPESIYPIIASALPEAVFHVIDEQKEFCLSDISGKKNCILIGCGISTSDFAQRIVKNVIETSQVVTILDADALNIISKDNSALKSAKTPVIITPHNMEMARLSGKTIEQVLANRKETALEFSKEYNVITVLKGDETIVTSPDGRVMYNTMTGNPGMATGGSGDVLAGVMASIIAQGSDPYNGACSAVYIHGLAGDFAKEKFGEVSMLPTDIVECLPDAFKSLDF